MIHFIEIEILDHHIETRLGIDRNRIPHLDQTPEIEEISETIIHIIDLRLDPE